MTRDISRKTFLRVATGAIATTALFGSVLALAVPDALGGPKIPAGLKLRGANHVCNFDQGDSDSWAALWEVWDWNGWLKPQLDDIRSVGNAVRFWGFTLPVANGTLTLTQYLAHWRQVLDYTHSLGLLLYATGGDLRHWGNFTHDQAVQMYTQLAQLLATYPHVIGMDVVNEAAALPWGLANDPNKQLLYNQPEPYDTFVQELGGVVRAAGIPIAYSRSVSSADEWLQQDPLDSCGDFLDFHVYYTPGPEDSLPIYSRPWAAGKTMLVGEFGCNTTVSSTDRIAYYSAIKTMTVNDPNCVGAIAWSAYDLSTTKDWQYGLFDRNRVLRQDIGKPFSTFPVRVPHVNPVGRVLEPLPR